jgi:excisionase family DNA binding protein
MDVDGENASQKPSRVDAPETQNRLSVLAVGVEPHRLRSIGSAAEYLGVSRATVERLVYRGELPIVKVAASTRYDVADLDAYIENNRRRNRRRSA